MPIIRSTETIDGDEVTILVEVDKAPPKPSPYDEPHRGNDRSNKVIESARDVFDDGISLARACAKKAVNGINLLDDKFRPEEFELTLAISLDSEMGAFIAKASAGAQMEVTMRWKPRE
ncbi:MAG: hypothetical protein F6K00_26900 [Leptolyngbya sp. SIOISBB]|nr:hypothetical protein [Leptolyngbya sp. SIOISBB]